VIFALFPLGVSLFFRNLTDTLTTDTLADSPEILFFALMVSATAMGDLIDLVVPLKMDAYLMFLSLGLLLGIIISAILFGVLEYDRLVNPSSVQFRSRLLPFSVGLAIALGVFSTIVEVFLARIGGE
jgi:hypothetical protein